MTKTITITDDAYARLASLKRDGESFSQVIARVTGKFALADLVGILSARRAREVRSHVRSLRRGIRRRLDRTAARLK